MATEFCERMNAQGNKVGNAAKMPYESEVKMMNIEKIREHYEHAKSKHPYFCDKIAPVDLDKEDREGLVDYIEAVKMRLSDMRSNIKVLIKKGELDWNDLVLCELCEVDEAIANGDTTAAVEECYDAIAVLLRVVDVLEGRQALGNPKKKGCE